ncbi:transcriptional coactivator p15/PC4 family protein [Caballeronia sp. S22]|uniref:transcriptional coactivator p15/PC4 family protein n=1 Tax=Caballeronia sp. S22 TaxID=3137182 RepID=UPI0035316B20
MTDKKMAGAKASPQVQPIIRNHSGIEAHGTQFLDLRKSKSERLRVHVRSYRGSMFIDLRAWYVGEDGEYRPSGKGVTLQPDQVPEITRALFLAGQSFDPKEVG